MNNINLLPVEYRPKPSFSPQSFFKLFLPVLLVFILLLWVLSVSIDIWETRSLIKEKEGNIEILQNKLVSVESELNSLVAIENLVKNIEQLEESSVSFTYILDTLEEATPVGVELTSFNIREMVISIQAEGENLSVISTFLDNLYNWEFGGRPALSGLNYSNDKYFFSVQIEGWRVSP